MKAIIRLTMLAGFLTTSAAASAAQMAPPPPTLARCTPRSNSSQRLNAAVVPELTAAQLVEMTRLLELEIVTAPRADIVESRIDGDFDGWEGDTIFALENGQVWQQSATGAKYYFANRPTVRIYGNPTTLHIDGFAASIAVRRIK